MTAVDVVIVGGGISGLSAARELCRQGFRVRLLERDAQCGGVIQTRRVGKCVVDVGPDMLLGHKPAAIELCKELGLEDQLVAPGSPRTTFVLTRGTLQPLPETSMLGLPTNWTSLIGTGAFTWRGKLRMAAEALVPPARLAADESIASFVGRRFGHEAVKSLAEPLLAGIHRGDATRLSMRALFPTLLDAEREHGSVLRSMSRKEPGNGRAGSMSLRGGLGQLVERLEHSLPRDVVVTGAPVLGVDGRGPFTVRLAAGEPITATAVLFATPAPVTARLVDGLDRDLAALCGGIESAPSTMVVLAYERDAVAHPLEGWGFVVPAAERRRLAAASWVSSKWPHRAPMHQVLIRASFGRMSALSPSNPPDGALIAWADDELRACLRIGAPPIAAQVYRQLQAMPQLTIGHLDRMAAIDERLLRLPGVFVSAAGFRGVGIPDCIADARAVARTATAWLRGAAARAAAAAANGAQPAARSERPLVFACSGCSFAGKLADSVARELDHRQVAEMSCLAGVGAKHASFLRQLPGRPVWIIDGCPIECARGVFEQAAQREHVTRHIRLHDLGFKKNRPPAEGVDVPELARRVGS
jgi:protoporphyrinogen/coproporphyrinogen III oxidase